MITVKSFVDCSFCNETYSADMDTASEDVFEEGIDALLNLPFTLETIDEDKGICICTKCFEKWLDSVGIKYDHKNGNLEEWKALINRMKDSPWNPQK